MGSEKPEKFECFLCAVEEEKIFTQDSRGCIHDNKKEEGIVHEREISCVVGMKQDQSLLEA